jgi:hypothetical protein
MPVDNRRRSVARGYACGYVITREPKVTNAAIPPGQQGGPAPQQSGSATRPGQVPGRIRRTSVLGTWGARVVLIIVAACAVLSVVFILAGVGGDTITRVIATDVALIAFALLVWGDTALGGYRPEWFEFVSLGADAYLLLLWVLITWTVLGGSDGYGVYSGADGFLNAFLSLLFVRAMVALIDLARILRARWDDTVVRVLGLVAGIAFGALAILVTIPSPAPFNGLYDYPIYGRIIASIAVIGGVALVLMPLWGLLTHRRLAPAAGVGHPGAAHPFPAHPVPAHSVPGHPQMPVQSPVQQQVQAAPAPQPALPPTLQAPPAPASFGRRGPHPTAPPVPRAPGTMPVPQGAAGVQTGASIPTNAASSAQPTSTSPATPPPASPRPRLAWPTLHDGTPLPVAADGSPDFAAAAGRQLAWPLHADGTPVPAAPDGTPLYH